MDLIHPEIVESLNEKVNFYESQLHRCIDESLPASKRPSKDDAKDILEDYILVRKTVPMQTLILGELTWPEILDDVIATYKITMVRESIHCLRRK